MIKNKKFLIVLLVAAMMCCLALTASAAGGAEIWVDHVEAAPGEDIYINATLFSNPGVMVVDLNLSYDDDLILMSVKDGGTLGDYLHGNNTNANPFKLTWNNMADVTTERGIIASLTFKVSEAARPGDVLDIKLDVVEAYNYNDQDVDIVTVYGYVEVVCAHKNVTKTGEIPPKCNEVGYTESAFCEDCETYISGHEEIPATGKHVSATGKYESDAAEHYYVCGDCGEKFDNEPHDATVATCIEKSVCKDCEYEMAGVDADNHVNVELKNEKEAGCTAGGYSGDLYCNDCKNTVEQGRDTPATGEHSGGTATCQTAAKCMYCGSEYGDKDLNEHEGSDGKWSYNEHGHYQMCICGELYNDATHSGGKATCAAKAKCEVCGAEYGSVDTSTHGETVTKNQTAASCVRDGYTGDVHCKDCDALISTGETIKTTGAHGGGTATCISHAKCDGCGREYGEKDPNKHGETVVKDAVEATCSKEGYTGDTYCKDCNVKLESGKAIPVTGAHTGGEATCNAAAICANCGAEYGEKNADKHVKTEDKNAKDATCTVSGYTGDEYCVDCGAKVAAGSEIPATKAHVDKDKDNYCDTCDGKLKPGTLTLDTGDSDKDDGCGSVASAPAVVMLAVVFAGALMVIKRKRSMNI